jgi:hypothetical protein
MFRVAFGGYQEEDRAEEGLRTTCSCAASMCGSAGKVNEATGGAAGLA